MRFDPFSGDRPRWYAVEACRPFLEDLAAGVLDWLGDKPPEVLSDALVEHFLAAPVASTTTDAFGARRIVCEGPIRGPDDGLPPPVGTRAERGWPAYQRYTRLPMTCW